MKLVPDQNRNAVNADEAITAIDDLDLDAPGAEYRAIKEEMSPLPREEMPPEPMPDHLYRILTAVGPKIVPPDLDWEKLLHSIEESVDHYRVLVELRSDKPKRDEISRLNQIIKTAKQFADMVDDELTDQDDEALLRGLLEDWIGRRESKVSDLEFEIIGGPEWYQQIKKPGKNGVPEYRHIREGWGFLASQYEHRNPFEWLVGHFLPKIFETHFGHQETFTPKGAYARFADAVLREFNIMKNDKPYTRSYIVREANRVSRSKVRPGRKLSRA